MNTATKYFLFELFILGPAILIIFSFLAILFVAFSPVIGYSYIKRRWNGDEKARKDLEAPRKGGRSY
jgi:hypothetical protein